MFEPLDIGGAIQGALAKEVEEDAPPIDLLEAAPGESGRARSPIQEAPFWIALREAVAALRAEELDGDGFVEKIRPIYFHISQLIDLFSLPQVSGQLDRASPEEQRLAGAAEDCLRLIESGIERLIEYLEELNPICLEEGLARIEKGYLDLEATQQTARELSGEDEDDGDED